MATELIPSMTGEGAGSGGATAGMFRRVTAALITKFVVIGLAVGALPVYVHALGVEAYGIVGIFTSLLALTSVADVGLSATLTRELALQRNRGERTQTDHDLVRTLEVLFWGLALAAAVIASVAAVLILGTSRLQHAGPSGATSAPVLMGVAIALQLPLALYEGGLLGRRRQVRLAVITTVMSTVRAGGGIVIVTSVSSTLVAYFSWQVVAAAVHTGIVRRMLWRELRVPKAPVRARFRWSLLRGARRFSSIVWFVGVGALVVTQLDRFMLAGLLSPVNFGRYVIAAGIATGLTYIGGALLSVGFPQMTHVSHDAPALSETYHVLSQAVCCAVVPASAVLAFFAKPILAVWLGNIRGLDAMASVAAILAIGHGLNALSIGPYGLQLATGRLKPAMVMTALSIVGLVPLLLVLTRRYQLPGAAAAWALMNAGYLVGMFVLTHRRLLRGERHEWLVHDALLPGVACIAVVGLARLGATGLGTGGQLVCGAVAAPLSVLAGLAASRQLRARAWTQTRRFWRARQVAGSVR